MKNSKAQLLSIFCVLVFSLGICEADPLNYWTAATSGTTNNLNAVLYVNGIFVAVGDAGTILTSADGVNWGAQNSGTANALEGIVYGGGKYVAVGTNDTVLISTDATNWTLRANATGSGDTLNSVAFRSGQFVATGFHTSPFLTSDVYVSPDAIAWTQSYYTISGTMSGVVWGNGTYAALLNGGVLISSDATNWTTGTGGSLSDLNFVNGEFVATGENISPYLTVSQDGTHWTGATHFPGSGSAGPLAGGLDQFSSNVVVVAEQGGFFASGTGVGTTNDAWTSRPVPLNTRFSGIAYGQNPAGKGVFAAVGGSNILYSVIYTGAIQWTNTAGGNWSDPKNWSPNEVPGQLGGGGSPDDAAITAAGTYTVVMDVGDSSHYWDLHSLSLGDGVGGGTQTLLISNKILYANPINIVRDGVLTNYSSTFHAVMNVSGGGQLNSANGIYYVNPLSINSGGTMTATGDEFHQALVVTSGGAFTTPSGVTVDSDCAFSAGGAVNVLTGILTLYGPMTNSGLVSLYSNGGIYVYKNNTASYQGYFLNQAGGTVNLKGGNGIQGNFGLDRVDNQGVIVNSGGGLIAVTTFDTSAGTVSNLTVGTAMRINSFRGTLAGQFYTTNGATTQFAGGSNTNYLTPGAPLVLGGGGEYQFVDGNGLSYLDLPTDIVPNLRLVGGIIRLEPGFQGGSITNLALDGSTITNTLPVSGTFNVTNSPVYGNWITTGNAMLNLNGCTLHGAVQVNLGATVNTPGATVGNDGSLTMNGVLNIPTGVLYLYGPMTNSGAVTLTSNAGIYIYNDGSANYDGFLLNRFGGLIQLDGGNGIQGGFGRDTFVNQGVIVNSGGNQISMTYFYPTAGLVTNNSGTLQIKGFTNTLAGAFYGSNGTTTSFSGGSATSYLMAGNLILAGGGTFNFSSGWLDLASTVPSLNLVGGVLKLEPNFQGGAITNLTLDGITFTNSVPLPITGKFFTTNSALAGAFLVNSGGVWNAYNNNIYGPVTINSGGVFNDLGAAQLYPPGWMTVAANGQLNLSGGDMYLNAPLTNSGVVTLQQNYLLHMSNNGSSFLGGVVNQPGGLINLLGTSGISGTGYGQEFLVNNGNITGANNSINVANFTNAAALTVTANTFSLGKVTLLPSSSLTSEIGDPVNYGKFSINGAAALTGAFDATLSFTPAPGTVFNVLSYGSHSGTFNSYNLPAVVGWQTQYNSTAFSLMVGLPQFTESLSGTNLIISANDGTSGNKGVLLTSTNINQPLAQWTPISTNTFDSNGHFDATNAVNFGQPKQFYILKYQ